LCVYLRWSTINSRRNYLLSTCVSVAFWGRFKRTFQRAVIPLLFPLFASLLIVGNLCKTRFSFPLVTASKVKVTPTYYAISLKMTSFMSNTAKVSFLFQWIVT